jgi:hypothetical protein
MSEITKKAATPLKQDQQFQSKGAVEQDRPGQPDNMSSFTEQIDHRDQRPFSKSQDTDFPEQGSTPEYSMQKQESLKKDPNLRPKNDPDGNAANEIDNRDPGPDPGERQKENQNQKKDDDLAA